MNDLDLTQLPQDALYSIALNPSAEARYRKAAVRLMLAAGYKRVEHPDLVLIVQDVKEDLAAEGDVQDAVETAIEAPLPENPGPLRASVTTRTMFGDELLET